MIRRVLFVLLFASVAAFAQQAQVRPKPENRKLPQRPTPSHVDHGLAQSPTTWATLNKLTSIPYPSFQSGLTFSLNRASSYLGEVFDNYLVGLEDYGYFYGSTTVSTRPVYVFDVSSLSADVRYDLTGTGNQFSGSAKTLQVFDAADFGLNPANPFGNPLDAFAAGPTAIASTSLPNDTVSSFSMDVTSAVHGGINQELGGTNFSAFLLDIDDSPAPGTGYLWGAWDVNLVPGAAIATIPTLGEYGMIAFVLLLLTTAVVLSRKRNLVS